MIPVKNQIGMNPSNKVYQDPNVLHMDLLKAAPVVVVVQIITAVAPKDVMLIHLGVGVTFIPFPRHTERYFILTYCFNF